MKIYSKFEYKYMLFFQEMKDHFLNPVSRRLVRLKISANQVSVLSGLVALFSIILAISFGNPLIFLIGIWIHLFLDGLDGSIARLSGSRSGATGLAADLISDSVGIATLGLYAFYFTDSSLAASLVFIAAYFGVNYISYIFAKTEKQYSFIIRPRFFVMIAIVFDYTFLYSITPQIILISDVLLSIFFLIGIKKIYTV